MRNRRKTNRDHAKKQHQPAVEDEMVAAQLEELLTECHLRPIELLSPDGIEESNLKSPIDVSSSADITMAKRTWSQRTEQNTRQRRCPMSP
jgi:hypothetical protein